MPPSSGQVPITITDHAASQSSASAFALAFASTSTSDSASEVAFFSDYLYLSLFLLIFLKFFLNLLLVFLFRLTHCYQCWDPCSLAPLPCNSCTHWVFCSLRCRSRKRTTQHVKSVLDEDIIVFREQGAEAHSLVCGAAPLMDALGCQVGMSYSCIQGILLYARNPLVCQVSSFNLFYFLFSSEINTKLRSTVSMQM